MKSVDIRYEIIKNTQTIFHIDDQYLMKMWVYQSHHGMLIWEQIRIKIMNNWR